MLEISSEEIEALLGDHQVFAPPEEQDDTVSQLRRMTGREAPPEAYRQRPEAPVQDTGTPTLVDELRGLNRR